MDGKKSSILYFDGVRYYPVLEIIVKSFADQSPLDAIIASRAKGKKIKPWVPQEENSVYVGTPQNTVFITDTSKVKASLIPGDNKIKLPENNLSSNILSPYVSWHGKEGTLSVKGLKDTTLTKQTSQEYSEDIIPSIKRDDMAGMAVCVLEVVLPVNVQSYKEAEEYETAGRSTIIPVGVTGAIQNNSYIVEHPTDIILTGDIFDRQYISALFFVHTGTKLAPWTLERVIDDLICEPITITNAGYKGAVNCTLLLRSLGKLDDSNVRPILFSVKSSDLQQQLFFQAFKYGV